MNVTGADLTVVANFHREGGLAYHALQSACLAVDAAARRGVRARVLAVLDRPDGATRREVGRHAGRLHGALELDAGDLATARNAAAQHVDTPWVAWLDGDDLFDADWLWKGLRHLQEDGDPNAVAHAEVRLKFGSERAGRVQISTESPLFHPLNLITSWHWAADAIAPVALYRQLPFVPNDHPAGFGGEDWLWSCESVLAGIRHLVVPETAYFYRRQARHRSLGSVPGNTFRPTRLLDPDVLPGLLRRHPAAALRVPERAGEPTRPAYEGSGPPPWLRAAVRRAARIDADVRALEGELAAVPLRTMPLFPEVGHLYVTLMAAVRPGRAHVVVCCDRPAAATRAVVDALRRTPAAPDVLVLSLAAPAAASADAPFADAPADGLRHVDLGAEALWARVPDVQRSVLVSRFLLQLRPLLAVTADGAVFDGVVRQWADALRSGGVRTARVLGSGDAGLRAGRDALVRADAGYALLAGADAAVVRTLLAELPEPAQTGPLDVAGLLRAASTPPAPIDAGVVVGPTAEEPAPDLSCVLVARAEGRHLIGALRALAAACDEVRRDGRSVEAVVVADRPGPRTRAVLRSLPVRLPGARLIAVDAGDDATAVNAGVAAARGHHVAILGGAHVVTPGYLRRALRLVEVEGGAAIARPGTLVTGDAALVAVAQADMRDAHGDVGQLATADLWAPVALARRELLRRLPWRAASPGSGWGDPAWDWSCETVQAGCRHLAVAETAVVRLAQGDGERALALGGWGWTTPRPSRFFTDHPWLRAGAPTGGDDGGGEAAGLAAEWQRLTVSVPELADRALPAAIQPPARRMEEREAYRACRAAIDRSRPSHILLVPWLGPGGSELAARLCADAILSRPENRVLVIVTQAAEVGPRAGLSERTTVLPFAAIAAACSFEARVEILTRLLVNAPARALHVFFSGLGWEVLRRHAAPLAERMRIFVSLFSLPPASTGLRAEYPRRVATLRPHLAAVLTDNQRAAAQLMRACGLDAGQVVVLRHPVAPRPPFADAGAAPARVLWAGRLDPGKRPDLLGAIAGRLPHRRFDVWGAPVLSDGREFAALAELPNVRLRGPFAGFAAIPDAPYGCFLYTSLWDGLPNVLLEAVAAGLLAVGSDVGAVREAIGNGGGVLVRPAGNPAAYADAIERALGDRAWAQARAARGRRQVLAVHTREGFLATLAAVPGYL